MTNVRQTRGLPDVSLFNSLAAGGRGRFTAGGGLRRSRFRELGALLVLVVQDALSLHFVLLGHDLNRHGRIILHFFL